jgi:predicted transport protein
MKTELLKVDSSLEFRVKGHYISLRKDRNIAFFQLGRNKLSIVIANPEKGMREQIKHHSVRTLAESVKKFWNGNENCFTVVIELKEHLEEVLNLLKKMTGTKKINGNEPASQDEGIGKKKTKVPPKVNIKAKQDKSDKKPQTKKK